MRKRTIFLLQKFFKKALTKEIKYGNIAALTFGVRRIHTPAPYMQNFLWLFELFYLSLQFPKLKSKTKEEYIYPRGVDGWVDAEFPLTEPHMRFFFWLFDFPDITLNSRNKRWKRCGVWTKEENVLKRNFITKKNYFYFRTLILRWELRKNSLRKNTHTINFICTGANYKLT